VSYVLVAVSVDFILEIYLRSYFSYHRVGIKISSGFRNSFQLFRILRRPRRPVVYGIKKCSAILSFICADVIFIRNVV
jgi:hypothetical protein